MEDSILKNFESIQIIPEGEKIIYWSIRIVIDNDDHTTNHMTKEIWKCKEETDADVLIELLNKFDYYWIPTSTKGRIIKVKEIV